MGRDGQIVVDDRDDDKLDDELDSDPNDGDEGDDEDEGDSSSELERLRQENARLLTSNEKLEKANTRNNAEMSRTRKARKLIAELNRLGVEDVDAWLEEQKGQPSPRLPQAPPSPEGVDEGSESPAETPETPATGVKPPMTVDDAEVARRVALALEQRDAQETERVSLLEDELRISRVEALLASAKFKGTLEKALRVIDMDSILVDEDGKVTGVEDAVTSLQQEIPEWFGERERPNRQRGTRDVDGGDKPRTPPRAQTWADRISNQISGR